MNDDDQKKDEASEDIEKPSLHSHRIQIEGPKEIQLQNIAQNPQAIEEVNIVPNTKILDEQNGKDKTGVHNDSGVEINLKL